MVHHNSGDVEVWSEFFGRASRHHDSQFRCGLAVDCVVSCERLALFHSVSFVCPPVTLPAAGLVVLFTVIATTVSSLSVAAEQEDAKLTGLLHNEDCTDFF